MKAKMWLWMVPVLLLAAWLGIHNLGVDNVWYDEAITVRMAGGAHYGPLSPLDVPARLAAADPIHVPLFFMMMNVWGGLVGWFEGFPLRVPALFMGLLALALTYRLGASLVSPRAGLFAALILIGTPFFNFFLHEMRPYTQQILVVALMMWLYWRCVATPRNRRWTEVALALTISAGLYTQYLTSLPIFSLCFYHLLFVRKDRRWWRITLLIAAAGATFLPWVGVLVNYVRGTPGAATGTGVGVQALIPALVDSFSSGYPLLWGLALASIPLWRQPFVRFVWTIAFATIAMSLLVADYLYHRHFVVVWVPLALTFAIALDVLSRRRLRLLVLPALALWVSYGVVNSADSQFMRASNPAFWQGMRLDLPFFRYARDVWHNAQPDDLALFTFPETYTVVQLTYDYYMGRVAIPNYIMEMIAYDRSDPQGYYHRMLELIHDRARVWVGLEKQFPSDLLPIVQRALSDAGFTTCGARHDDAHMRVEIWSRAAACCAPENAPQQVRFGGASGTSIASVLPLTVQDGALPVLTVQTDVQNVPPGVYSMALYALDAGGQVAAQVDFGIASGYACEMRYLPVAGLPGGDYTLAVVVYDWQQGTRLPGMVPASGATGDLLPLGVFTIEP